MGNIRKVVDTKDRQRKNIILTEWLTHKRCEDSAIDVINLYNEHL